MALTLPIAPSSTPSDRSSSTSDERSVSPQTPNSPANVHAQALAFPLASHSHSSFNDLNTDNMHKTNNPDSSRGANAITTQETNVAQFQSAAGQHKRKTSRRVNTAERRATHNAVERQRRETLNGRFLDLAALLPNLSQIRRPSKSAIVNSSIAHVHASRRHRLLASRELRILKAEADALRKEVNDWRNRAGLSRVDEPLRSEGFGTVLSGDLELFTVTAGPGCANGPMEEDEGGLDGFDDGDEDFAAPPTSAMPIEEEDAMAAMLNSASAAPLGNLHGGNTVPNAVAEAGIPPVMARDGPMIAQMPPSVSFENPVMPSMYEPHVHYGAAAYTMGQQQQYHPYQHVQQHASSPKWAADFTYSNTMQYPTQQRAMVTPPTHIEHAQILANLKRQQHLFALHQHQQSQQMGYSVANTTVDADDTSSVTSSRSGSGMSDRDAGYVSPVNYETYDAGGSVQAGMGVGGMVMRQAVVSDTGYAMM